MKQSHKYEIRELEIGDKIKYTSKINPRIPFGSIELIKEIGIYAKNDFSRYSVLIYFEEERFHKLNPNLKNPESWWFIKNVSRRDTNHRPSIKINIRS